MAGVAGGVLVAQACGAGDTGEDRSGSDTATEWNGGGDDRLAYWADLADPLGELERER